MPTAQTVPARLSLAASTLALLLFASGAALAEPAAPPAAQDPWKSAPGAREFPGASSLLLKDVIECRVHPDGSHDLIEQDAIRVLDKEGVERFGKVVRSYDDRLASVEVAVARIWMPDGRRLDLPASQITDTLAPAFAQHPLYGRVHVLVIDYRQVVPGAVLEYRIVHHRRAAWPGRKIWESSYTQDASPMLDTSFILSAPRDVRFNVTFPGTPGLAPTSIQQSGDFVTSQWQLTNRPSYTRQPVMPSVRDVASQIHASTFASWEDFALWAGRLYAQATEPDAALQAQAATIVGSATTPRDKVGALLAWLQKEKPVFQSETGLDEMLPQPAAQTARLGVPLLQQDRAVLLLGLLRAAGLPAHMALVSSADHGDPQRGAPALSQFDRLLITWREDRQQHWLDPATHAVDAPSPTSCERPALVLTQDGTATFTTTPSAVADHHRELLQGIARIDPDGSLDATLQIFEHGSNTTAWRRLATTSEPAEQRQVFQMLVNSISPNASLRDFYMQPGTGSEPCKMTLSLEQPSAATYSAGSRLWQVRLPLLKPRRLLGYAEGATAARLYPVCMGTTTYEEQRLELVLPTGWHLRQLPPPVHLENAAGTLETLVQVRGRSIYYHNRLVMRKPTLPKAAFADFKALITRLGESAQLRFDLEGPPPAPPSPPQAEQP